MTCNYKTTYNLIPDQIAELKSSLFYNDPEGVFEGLTSPDEIPDSVVHEHYKGINFVNDDFFCTADMDDDEVLVYMINRMNEGKEIYHYEIDFAQNYSIAIRTDIENLDFRQATQLLQSDIKKFGEITGIFSIEVKDMVYAYECENYAQWPLHHEPD